jgi:glycoprotein-N-acetylgalactosamine 3-beta-galactosyltransferase
MGICLVFFLLFCTLVVIADDSWLSDCSPENMKVRIRLNLRLKNESLVDVKFESGVIASVIFYLYDFCYRINGWLDHIQETLIENCDETMIEAANQYIQEHGTNIHKTEVPCVQYEEFLYDYPMSPYLASHTVYRSHLSWENLPRFCRTMYPETEPRTLDLLHPLPESPNPSPRLLCMIFTTETKHESIIPAIIRTWGGRCTGFLASSTRLDLPVSALNIPHEGPEAYDNMWAKVVSIWNYVYESHRDEFDWFYIAGDDTFVIVENLLQYLHSLETIANKTMSGNIHERYPFYLGRAMYTERFDEIFNSGGAGYVLNRKSLSILYNAFHDPTDPCEAHLRTSEEDYMVAKCLRKYAVLPVDTRDAENDNRDRFHAMTPWSSYYSAATGVGVNAYWTHRFVFFRNGSECCSPNSISFQEVKSPEYLYSLDAYLRVCKPNRHKYENYVDET